MSSRFSKKTFKIICKICLVTVMLIELNGCFKHENQATNFSANNFNELKISSQKDILLGKKIIFYSKILKESRSLLIHLPKSYYDNSIYPKKYPVLYVLDGKSSFDYTCGVVDFMSSAGVNNNYQIPEMIVVAIPNKEPSQDNRFRDYSPTQVRDYYQYSGGGPLFLKFLSEELIPFINKNYRTMPFRILAGHSMGGLITTYDFLSNHSIFNAYIAMDPSLWWDNKMIFSMELQLRKNKLKKLIYISTYGKALRKNEYRNFVQMLVKKNSLPFRAKFQVFDNETHGSLPLVSLYNGLLFIFDGFHPNLDEFVNDPALINNHFAKFSQKMGIKFLPPEDLIHDVCVHAIKENPDKAKAVECFRINAANYPESYNATNAQHS